METYFDLDKFEQSRILVIGDMMLDRYLWGDVERISPEAPVPVFRVKEKTEAAGGAGNIVSNLVGLGCSVAMVSVCGDDEAGQRLTSILSHEKVKQQILKDRLRPTITKTRAMARSQQLLRLDEEQTSPLSLEMRKIVVKLAKEACSECDAIILSDYGKGVLSSLDVCEEIILYGRSRNMNVMVDPKGRDWGKYYGATCVTPNILDMELVYGGTIRDEDHLWDAMREVIERYDLSRLLVTRGPKGIAAMERSMDGFLIPTMAREVYDVSGAGDTVIATLTAAVTAGCPFPEAAKLANLAAGIVVGKLGTQPITRMELETSTQMNGFGSCAVFSAKITSLKAAETLVKAWKSSSKKIVFTNGCFDLLHPGHIHLLNSAKRLGDRLVVGLNSDMSVRRSKGPKRPILDERARSSLLGSLDAVDLVVTFNEDTPENVLRVLKPDILVKGDDYKADDVIGREIVESGGGKIHLIPVLKGFSTTKITELVIETQGK
jgi:D-beta-D-heptose 7-phosphate kinase/D-beta-D-heptose 1-phosphate adenosyltransferase